MAGSRWSEESAGDVEMSDQLLFARQPPNCIRQKVNLAKMSGGIARMLQGGLLGQDGPYLIDGVVGHGRRGGGGGRGRQRRLLAWEVGRQVRQRADLISKNPGNKKRMRKGVLDLFAYTSILKRLMAHCTCHKLHRQGGDPCKNHILNFKLLSRSIHSIVCLAFYP